MLDSLLFLRSELVSIVLLGPIKHIKKLPLWVVEGHGVDFVEQVDADEDRLLAEPEGLEQVRVVEPVLKKCAEQSHVDHVKYGCDVDISCSPMAELMGQDREDLVVFALVMLKQLLCQVDVLAVHACI